MKIPWKRTLAAALALCLILGIGAAPVLAAGRLRASQEVARWDFDNNIGGWYYGEGWDGAYHGPKPVPMAAEDGQMRVDADWSNDGDNSWAQFALCFWYNDGFSMKGANRLTMDLTYERPKMNGELLVKAFSNAGLDCQLPTVTAESGENIGGGRATVRLSAWVTELGEENAKDLTICLVGVNTSYQGTLWLDNIILWNADPRAVTDGRAEAGKDIYVDAKLVPTDYRELSFSDSVLHTTAQNGDAEQTPLDISVGMVDANADANARRLYAYLAAIGRSESVIFGHQSNTWQKVGAAGLSVSDTMDLVGSYAGIIGLDALSLTGTEYSVDRYNRQFGTDYEDTQLNRVKVYAELSNWCIDNGAIMTLSSHMPNFALVERVEAKPGLPTYCYFDFDDYTCVELRGDTANKILPGGEYNEAFNAYLDLLADYAKQVKDAILFRPFHENTGSWFWWGAAFCDTETYRDIYRYAVEYLRDVKGVHNLIYVYGPGSEAASAEEYALRYPGDAWVDMLGFDMYHADPTNGDGWMEAFENELTIISDFAREHGKLVGVTETGVARSTPEPGDSATALLKSGNAYKGWYADVLDIASAHGASYFLTWTNFQGGTNGFYTPYAVSLERDGALHGHELMDEFIDFFNDPRSVFAVNQRRALLGDAPAITATAAVSGPTGYFVFPVSGTRVLEQTEFRARLTNVPSGTAIRFEFEGVEGVATLEAASQDQTYYSAVLTAAQLEALGQSANGILRLMADNRVLTEQNMIYGIPEPKKDPHLVDDFEGYLGEDALLGREWTTNKATGSSITLSLSEGTDQAESGFGLRIDYSELSGGWAGATVSKEVDWSDCNALRFWTIPDANAQKIVVQISAAGQAYEAYMNLYDAYADNAGRPVLVTIPFAEFHKRDAAGQPQGGLVEDCINVTGFGLWINAVDNDHFAEGTVSGSIWYDNILAVSADNAESVSIVAAQSG